MLGPTAIVNTGSYILLKLYEFQLFKSEMSRYVLAIKIYKYFVFVCLL
jgi:hypothetical protein